MHAYDAAGVRAVDPHRLRRLAEPDLLAALTVEERRPPASATDGARAFDTTFDLAEGEYEARVWFADDRPRGGELRAMLSSQVVLARAAGPLGNPAVIRFRMAVPAPVRILLTDESAAEAAQRIDVVPLTLAAGAARSGVAVTAVDPVEGRRPQGYIAYADDRTYAEGGVFWTRGTETGHILLMRTAPRRSA